MARIDRKKLWEMEEEAMKKTLEQSPVSQSTKNFLRRQWYKKKGLTPPKPRKTRDQRVINDFLMTTSLEEFTRLREALLQQQPEPQPEPQQEEEEQDQPETRCKCGTDDYAFDSCGCDICFECFTKLFDANKKSDDDDVEIECPMCGQINIYEPDYMD